MEAPEFDPTMPNGGDTSTMDVNEAFGVLSYHWVYILINAFLVFLIIPGVGLLYGGLSRRRSALSMLFQSFMVTAVVTFQWMFWGYSLAYSRNASPFIGTLANFGFMNVMAAPSPGSALLPEIVFALYQLFFAVVTVMLVIGGAFERGRVLPTMVFSFCWATIVYCPIACWTWNGNGWLYNLPSLDYAGGGPVHIASGCSALAYALILGKRKAAHEKPEVMRRPHNVSLVFIGTVLIWFGWFGFNGGSTLNATVRSGIAAFNTNTAASMGVFGWCLVDYIRRKGKFSAVGACEGAIAGLVGITPAAGYVSVWLAAVIGLVTGICCSLLQDLNEWIRIDEGLDVFKLHGVGGMIGSFLTGIFASSSVSLLDGSTEASGAIDGNGIQVARQLADIAAVAGYSFVVTCILLLAINYVPGLKLRVSEQAEVNGLDWDQFFEEDVGDWSQGHYGFNNAEISTKRPSANATLFEGENISSSGAPTPPNEEDKVAKQA